jgi:hypothetical protein
MFQQLDLKINLSLKENRGLQICTPHTDVDFQLHFAKQLMQNLAIKRIFIEFPPDKLEDYKRVLEKPLSLTSNKEIICDAVRDHIQGLPYIAVCALIYNIQVIPIDLHSCVLEPIRRIMYGEVPCTELEKQKLFDIRISQDKHMVDTTRENLASDNKNQYIIFTGPMHSGIAKQFGINCFSILERQFLRTFQSLPEYQQLKDKIKIDDLIFLYSSLAEKKASNLLYNSNGFFSPSKYATKEQPYGPYSDKFCGRKDDAMVDEGIYLSDTLSL